MGVITSINWHHIIIMWNLCISEIVVHLFCFHLIWMLHSHLCYFFILKLPPSHLFDHTITTKFYLFSRHQAINLVQSTITIINLDLPSDFYGGASRNLLKITVNILKATFYFVTKSTYLWSMIHDPLRIKKKL